VETSYKTKIPIMKAKLPFILCFSTEISEDLPLLPSETPFLSKEILKFPFFLHSAITQLYQSFLSKRKKAQ